jgi:phage terminase small subunit
MPRKSAAHLAINVPRLAANRLRPPATMSKPERKVFAQLVGTNPANHFRQSDAPLLHVYCEVIITLRTAASELKKGVVFDGKISPWVAVQERAIKSMVALSMRLRLSPQARAPNNPSRATARSSVYEEMRNGVYDAE